MCRDSQVADSVSDIALGPIQLGSQVMHRCGKSNLFRPQVWWGDNCARRVERQSSIAVCFISGTSYAIASKVPTIELSLTSHLSKRR
ncbi:MAG: hypothetical protein QOI97_2106 [Pseudomonas sp.]|jgi:hypothetical protein|nr:hypothetical protein [Pseudomonas sp.]